MTSTSCPVSLWTLVKSEERLAMQISQSVWLSKGTYHCSPLTPSVLCFCVVARLLRTFVDPKHIDSFHVTFDFNFLGEQRKCVEAKLFNLKYFFHPSQHIQRSLVNIPKACLSHGNNVSCALSSSLLKVALEKINERIQGWIHYEK